MINKSEEVRKLLKSGNVDEALKIGKSFNKGDKVLLSDIKRGYDASRNPNFYIQLKMNPEELYKKAIAALSKLVQL